jgi:tRNA (adenine57-N1/adenine58-N1)-methyltransferase
MVEVFHRRIESRRERYGIDAEGVRGAIPGPKSVEESVTKLREIEERGQAFHSGALSQIEGDCTPLAPKTEEENDDDDGNEEDGLKDDDTPPPSQPQIPAFKQGRLIHRSEPELKTHTSYLVFAVLPRAWSNEDEQKCRQAWPSRGKTGAVVEAAQAGGPQKSKRQLKHEARMEKKATKEGEKGKTQHQKQQYQ